LTPPAPRVRGAAWGVLAAIVTAPIALTLCAVLWRTPYPISEAVAVMQDASETTSTVRVFDPAARSWYRPFYFLTWEALLKESPSIDTALLLFRCLEVGSVVALWLLLIAEVRPRSWLAAVLAACAVVVLIGSPGFRDNLEIPLLMTLIAMPLVLLVWHLLEADHRWWHGPLIIALTLIAIGYKEQGLVLVPVVVVAWWLGAPGIGRATAASIVIVTLAYLAFRFSAAGSWPPFVQDIGLGFTTLSANEAAARFGRFPLPIYAYNVAATIANILFSEPTSGAFVAIDHLRSGEFMTTEIVNVVSSTVLSGVIAWWAISSVRRDARRPWSCDSRLAGVLLIAIAASGALGFNYTRDRHAGMAVVFYALAAGPALGELIRRASHSRVHLTAVVIATLVLSGAWLVRAMDTVDYARLTATKNRREWITNLQARRAQFAREPGYLTILDAMVVQGTQPTPPRIGSLADAIRNGEPEPVYAEIHAGANPNTPIAFSHPDLTGDREVMVAPMAAAVARHSDNAVMTLMSFGARMDLPRNRNAVCLARRLGYDDIAAMIVRDGRMTGEISCAAPSNTKYPLLDFAEP
jgi:hypothetical protein